MSIVLTEIDGQIGFATLNNPQKRNCLSNEMIQGLFKALDQFSAAGVRVVILRALPGSKVWCAGVDVGELPHPGHDPLPYTSPFEQLLRAIMDYPDPVIAMVEGGVWGGGCDLVFSCDLIVGSDTTSFAMTPARLGVPYNLSGMIHFINILGLNKVKEMFFTAAPISAQQAFNLGLLNHMLPVAELEQATRDLADQILRNSPLTIRAIKEELRLLSRGHPIDAETFEKVQAVRRAVYDSQDYIEGIQAFLEKRSPRFQGK